IPLVAVAAVQLGFALGGSIVIEAVFSLHGVGYLGWESISRADFPVVQAIVLILALFYIVLTLLADRLNAFLDPRILVRGGARAMTVGAYIDVTSVLPVSAGAALRRRVLGHTTFMIGAFILIFIVGVALFAPLLAPHDPYAQDLSLRLVPPVWDESGTWA